MNYWIAYSHMYINTPREWKYILVNTLIFPSKEWCTSYLIINTDWDDTPDYLGLQFEIIDRPPNEVLEPLVVEAHEALSTAQDKLSFLLSEYMKK